MKITKKNKTMINVYFTDELLAKIDKDAVENVRARSAQVEYIVKQYYKKSLRQNSPLLNYKGFHVINGLRNP